MTWGYPPNDYYHQLDWQKNNPNAPPLTEKQENDLKLLILTKHYEQVLRDKMKAK